MYTLLEYYTPYSTVTIVTSLPSTVIGNVWLDTVSLGVPSSLVMRQVKESWSERLSLTGSNTSMSCWTDVALATTDPLPDTHSIMSTTPKSLEQTASDRLPTVKGKGSLVMVTPAQTVHGTNTIIC